MSCSASVSCSPANDAADLIEKLAQRLANVCQGKVSNPSQDIRQVLTALDHPKSFYVVLSDAEKAAVRGEWQAAAKQLGIPLQDAATATPRRRRSKEIVPPALLAFFGPDADKFLPLCPRATNDYRRGMQRRPLAKAATCRSIELNPPAMVHWLIFDCDHMDTGHWQTAGLPAPSFITVNPANGHHHVAYRLTAPICISERGRSHPIQYMRAVRDAMRLALGGDPAYNGVLTKNPLHPDWQVIRTEVMPTYSLAELAAGQTLPGRARQCHPHSVPDLRDIQVGGRNRGLFDAVRTWAYRNDVSAADIAAYAHRLNAGFPEPMPDFEVDGIAASIAKYIGSSRQQRHQRQHGAAFRARQAARGRQGGRPCTTGKTRPWEAAGTSRATWYRRQRALGLRQNR